MTSLLPHLKAVTGRREFGLAVLITVITLIVRFFDPGFVSPENVRHLFVRCAPTAIVACGVMLVVVTGEIDISVGSLMALLAAVMGLLISHEHANLPLWSGVLLTLLTGTMIGLATGCLVTLGKVPSIIVTLGLLTALRGITTLVMDGENIDGLPDTIQTITKFGFFGVPMGIWVAIGVIAFTAFVISHTPLGRRLFAIGSSAESARMSGLSTTRLKIFVFAWTGFLTALATVVHVPRLPKIEAGIGSGFELLVVTCVVVGGVSISGGRGRILGVVLAVLLMTMVRPTLTFLDVGEAGEKWTKSIQGLFIMLAVVIDSLASRHAGRERRP